MVSRPLLGIPYNGPESLWTLWAWIDDHSPIWAYNPTFDGIRRERSRSTNARPFPLKGGTRCQTSGWAMKLHNTDQAEHNCKRWTNWQATYLLAQNNLFASVPSMANWWQTDLSSWQAIMPSRRGNNARPSQAQHQVQETCRSKQFHTWAKVIKPSFKGRDTHVWANIKSQESREISRANSRNWQHHHCARTRITTIKCKAKQVSAMKRSLIKLKLKKCNGISNAHVPFPGNGNWTKDTQSHQDATKSLVES